MGEGTVAYLYCPPNKEYDFDLMLELLTKVDLEDSPITEVYADGWTSIPNGLTELMADADKYSRIVLLNFEGLGEDDLRDMVEKCSLTCILAVGDEWGEMPWATKHTDVWFKEMCTIHRARDYYDNLRSMKIKAGMKKTDKHVGQVPFGHRRDEQGKLQEIPELMAMAKKVKHHYLAGVPVSDIARASSGLLTIRQVYGLMEHWGVKRG
jgi:hypothetical protein